MGANLSILSVSKDKLMADYFTCPSWVQSDPSGHALFGAMKWCRVGYAIYRDASGAYHQVTDSDDDVIKGSTEFYGGGRSYLITAQQKNDLTAAGYGQYVTASIP